MKPASPTPSPTEKTVRTSLGAFGLSVIVHVAALLLVGGYVIYEGVVPKTPFAEVPSFGEASDAEELPEPDAGGDSMEMPESSLTELAVTAESSTSTEDAATSSDLIVSTGANPLFSLPPAVGTPGATPRLGFGTGGSLAGSGSTSGGGGPGRGMGKRMATLFGSTKNDGASTMSGTLYDLKQTADRQPIVKDWTQKDVCQAHFNSAIGAFIQAEFSPRSSLGRFYRVPTRLFATHLYIQGISANEAPKAFNVEKEVEPRCWVVHYEGAMTPPSSGQFRFVAMADDFIAIALNKKMVLGSSIYGNPLMGKRTGVEGWNSLPSNRKAKNNTPLVFSDWIRLDSGRKYELDIIAGESPGGGFSLLLMIEEKGKTYPTVKSEAGDLPRFPLFKTAEIDEPETVQTFYPASAEGPIFTVTPPPGN